MERLTARLVVALTNIVGWGAILAIWAFFFLGSFNLVDLPLDTIPALGWDALLCLAFFVQHSGMIRKGFRRRLERVVPSHYHGPVYTIASGVVLLVLLVFWQESPWVLVTVEGGLRWLMRGVFVLSIAGMAWGVLALRSFDTFGVVPVRARLRGRPVRPTPFVIRGPYRWVRHPLYLCCLIFIWSCPDLTADRLLFNVLWTIWIVVGTLLEERDLAADFGESHRAYQRQVPMLIPYRIPQA